MSDPVSTEIASITQTMREDRGSYNRDPAMQSRLHDLFEAQETGGSAGPTPIKGEKAEIEKVMRTDINRYWRDQTMQARYRELLEQEPEAPSPQNAAPTSDGMDVLIALRTPSKWAADGNDPRGYNQHNRLVREANDVLSGMDDEDRRAFNATFDDLPSTVQAAALGTLLDRRSVSVFPLSENAVKDLVRQPTYASLAREWGYEAPHKLAVLQERLLRVMERLDERDVPAAVRWLDQLPASAMVSLAKKLVR